MSAPAPASRAAGVLAALARLTLVVVGAAGCVEQLEPCSERRLGPGADAECSMPGWLDRAYRVQVPSSWDGQRPLPVLVALHGGAGNRASAERVSCAEGELGAPGCLSRAALERGLVVVFPDGTGSRPLWNVRTWNAGGGGGGLDCTSGPACRSGVDDVRYLRELLDELGQALPVDPARVYATGLSNGAAMTHRALCALPELFAAGVAVGGTNQFAAGGGECPSPRPLLQVHGTDDPCWRYERSSKACLGEKDAGVKAGVDESMERWRVVNGCSEAVADVELPDLAADGTRAVRRRWADCAAPTELITVHGGGHTWPDGWQYLDVDTIGRVPRDFGSELLVEFLLDQGP